MDLLMSWWGYIWIMDILYYTNITTENYKTLYPGEHVSFELSTNKKSSCL